MNGFTFEPLSLDHLILLHQWLQGEHVRQFWDDGDRTLEEVKKHYWNQKDVQSWVASINGAPFAYLQIYFVTESHEFNPWRSKKYTTLGLDFFIGEPSFLGKGLAIPLIETFMAEILKSYLPYRLLVDPEVKNLKVLSIFNKMGFQLIGELESKGKYYHILKKEVSDKTVQIVPYDPNWPQIFKEEAPRIKEALGDNCLDVHHFGSTSVPGLSAKPKIDILAVVKSFAFLNISGLVKIGYEVRRDTIPTGKYLVKEMPRIHLHVFEEGNPHIQRNLLFRDWLRTHPEDLEAYAAFKKALAVQYNEHNGMAYSNAKTAFIDEIIQKATKHRKCQELP